MVYLNKTEVCDANESEQTQTRHKLIPPNNHCKCKFNVVKSLFHSTERVIPLGVLNMKQHPLNHEQS